MNAIARFRAVAAKWMSGPGAAFLPIPVAPDELPLVLRQLAGHAIEVGPPDLLGWRLIHALDLDADRALAAVAINLEP